MPDFLSRTLERLLRFLQSPLNRRRLAATDLIIESREAVSSGALSRVPMLRGEDTVMVRPYLVAHERRQALRHRLAHPHASRVVAHGVELGPWSGLGMQVVAR
ncbi:hypothetical protein [Streptomyces sp. NPDC017993]|uniref:hypothetical protein n=1 Tax=Streptomyces sp. NPDC017993 TaxID=3365027 RepID=UPI0037B985D9